MATHITVEPAKGSYAIRAGGAVIGETSRALLLREGGHEPVVYVPREDVATAFLDPSEKTTHCPHKGDATYFSIVTKSTTLPDAVWSYEDPKEGVAQIKGHLAFGGEGVAVEAL